LYSPKEVAQNYIPVGVAKTKLPISKMLILGILAGMFTGFAGVGSTISSATVESASMVRLLMGLMFPVGVAMSIVAGGELFTGNCLLIIPALEKQAKISGVLKNLVFVYIGNLLGGILVAALVVYGHTLSLFGNQAAVSAIGTAVAKVTTPFADVLYRGILCNVLICAAVWMTFAAKDVAGKIIGLFMPIMIFVLCAFENSVANMYYIAAGLFAATNPVYAAAMPTGTRLSELTWGNFFLKNLLPSSLGNAIGGAVLVGLAYWFVYLRGADKPALKAPVHAGKK
jgi:formate/nitrite transporter